MRRQDALAARRRPLEKESRALESRLEELGRERDEIDRALIAGVPAGEAIAAMHNRRAVIEAEIEAVELRWYETQEALAALEREPG